MTTETQIAEYSATAAALAELRTKYQDVVFDVATGKGMTVAKEARAELRGYRIALEAKRVEIKAPALERCRLIDAEAKRITAELSALEDPIDSIIKREEKRKEVEKADAEQRERDRMAAINARFDALKALPLSAIRADVSAIRELIGEAEAFAPESFDTDLRDAAVFEKRKVLASLAAALDASEAADKEAEKIAAERAELAALREAAERQAAAERERQESEERERRGREMAEAAAKRDAELKEQAERQAAERAEREKQEAALAAERAELAAQRAAEEKRAADERAELARQQAEFDAARAQAEREREAAAIAGATLVEAASEALALLKDKGLAKHVTTRKLESAIQRNMEQAA